MEARFLNACALTSLYLERACVHLGVRPMDDEVYVRRGDRERLVEVRWWLWGRAINAYDCRFELFGLGPFLLVTWRRS